ncbi:MAG: efflux RND transporter periplasmic adaptor subunit [Planctomycetes bacterium]|nr:efflux RND transporter periplasmic adaptor subunit [Planctomycetota bacterium]
MNRNLFLCIVLLVHSLFISAGCGNQAAAAVEQPKALEPTSTTVFGERLLLYLEYPHLVRGSPARFLAHLSVLQDGEPVRSGSVTLEIGSTRLAVNAPRREGLFTPEGSLPESGRFPGRLIVKSEQAEETLDLGEVTVHASAQEAAKAAEASAGDPPPNAAPFLMEQQWKVKLLLARAGPRALTRWLVVPAEVRTPEGAEAVVAPPVAGRLLAPANGALPRTGDAVEAGQVLGWVEPPLGAADLAQLQALQLEFDLKSLEVVRAVNEAQARLDYATRERERIAKLREPGLSTAQALDEAERNLSLARTDLESAGATKDSLDRMRAERAGASTNSALRFPLASPLRGTVIAVGRMQGQSAEPGDELFRILDASRVWVEGRVSEFDLHLVGPSSTGVVTCAALPGARFEVGGAEVGTSLKVLPTIDSVSRSAVLRCELQSGGGSIKPGMLAELEIATERAEAAVAMPLEAVLMEQGLPIAYVMLEGELFQKRELELGVKDGEFVEVRKGVAAGERVATRGAYVVKLAALSPTSFGPGHQH